MIVYEIQNLYKTYQGQTLPAHKNISLQIYQGEIFGILGDNGAGKSTFVRQMANLLKSDSGSITLFQKNIAEARDLVQMNVGYMPYYHFYRKIKGLRPLGIHVASVSVEV